MKKPIALLSVIAVGGSTLPSAGGRAQEPYVDFRTTTWTIVALGAALLWIGWFGFDAGSGVAADGLATRASS